MTIPAPFSNTGTSMATILVVDDMEANRAVLMRRLEKFGFDVACVDSGRAALAAIARSLPDIILLDYMMPQMNGIEVLRELRSTIATEAVPVIMVTARAEADVTVKALEAGADDYVTKPIDFDVLRARIETQLAKLKGAHQLKRANAALDERVTLRSMALADLEGELAQEIRLRQELERKLTDPAPSLVDAHVPIPPELAIMLTDMKERFDTFFAAAMSGRTLNLAQMAEFKSLIARCRQAAGG